MAAAVPMATLGIFGLSNVIIQPINTVLGDQLEVRQIVTANVNAVAVPVILNQIQIVNLTTNIVRVPSNLRVIRITDNGLNC